MTEPAAVLQALVERINPTTPAESARDLVETLAGLVTRAANGQCYALQLAIALRDAQVQIYEAMQGVPLFRDPVAQGVIGRPSDAHRPGAGKRWACPRCGHDLEASIALLGPEWKGEP